MRILAVDPGLATGWCLLHDGQRLEGETPSPLEFIDWAVTQFTSVDHVVCEAFIITARTATLSPAPWSLEIIGALRWLCHRYGVPFTLQTPTDAKRFATEDKLMKIGWDRPPGAGHARDAQRHMLLFLVRQELIDAAMLL